MAESDAVSRELQRIAADLEKQLEKVAGRRLAFTLLVYTEGRASYIGNASRDDAAMGMKTLLTQWGHQVPDIPAHLID